MLTLILFKMFSYGFLKKQFMERGGQIVSKWKGGLTTLKEIHLFSVEFPFWYQISKSPLPPGKSKSKLS